MFVWSQEEELNVFRQLSRSFLIFLSPAIVFILFSLFELTQIMNKYYIRFIENLSNFKKTFNTCYFSPLKPSNFISAHGRRLLPKLISSLFMQNESNLGGPIDIKLFLITFIWWLNKSAVAFLKFYFRNYF